VETHVVPHASIVEQIERAIETRSVAALASTLAQLSAGDSLSDPGFFASARSERYRRRLLWRDPKRRFVIVAMTWGPNQGAQLHDHGGLWGGEVVVRGAMHEERFRALECDPARGTRFERCGESVIRPGTVGVVEPPHEYHTYRNAAATVSHTLHVYAGPFDSCIAYTPSDGEWWTGEPTALNYDS
jgi:predicted metal-dependent enzyme (double-stranded beta helix superfamily)